MHVEEIKLFPEYKFGFSYTAFKFGRNNMKFNMVFNIFKSLYELRLHFVFSFFSITFQKFYFHIFNYFNFI